jgi:hypothetical protein
MASTAVKKTGIQGRKGADDMPVSDWSRAGSPLRTGTAVGSAARGEKSTLSETTVSAGCFLCEDWVQELLVVC